MNKKKVIGSTLFRRLTVLLYSVTAFLLITEIFLRCAFPSLKSHGEQGGNCYASSYGVPLTKCDSCNGGFFFIGEPNAATNYVCDEFSYKHRYNSLGLRDHEFSAKKQKNEFRIIALGDAFVEGAGTTEDSTWVKQLEHLLARSSDSARFTALNAGVLHSDLFFSYDLFYKCLLKYKPDLVILGLNSTDVSDVMFRGAFERYDSFGRYHPMKGPWWEFFFGTSYIVRMFILNVLHYNQHLLSENEEKIEQVKVMSAISKKLDDYRLLAQKMNFAFLLVLQPMPDELNGGSTFISKLKVDSAIDTVDLTGALIDSIKQSNNDISLFYWPRDGHLTSRGYLATAEIIYDKYFSPGCPGYIKSGR
jgi:hypothetical protein